MILTHGGNSISRGYNGPFILLNNFDTMETVDGYTQLKSLIGPSLFNSGGNIPGVLESSVKFSGDISLRRTGTGYIKTANITHNSRFLTTELYVNTIGQSDSFFAVNQFSINIEDNIVYLGGQNISDVHNYGSATVYQWVSNITMLKLPMNPSYDYVHAACVLDDLNKRGYVFYNGLLLGDYSYQADISSMIFSTGGPTNQLLEFVSIRKGDFSNNLQSFTVPTEKYHL